MTLITTRGGEPVSRRTVEQWCEAHRAGERRDDQVNRAAGTTGSDNR